VTAAGHFNLQRVERLIDGFGVRVLARPGVSRRPAEVGRCLLHDDREVGQLGNVEPEREGGNILDIEECLLRGVELLDRGVVGGPGEQRSEPAEAVRTLAPERLIDFWQSRVASAHEHGRDPKAHDEDKKNEHLTRREGHRGKR
jgi:hypothetical protein